MTGTPENFKIAIAGCGKVAHLQAAMEAAEAGADVLMNIKP
jgi:hypothetical protein